jgi:hypothetical protein
LPGGSRGLGDVYKRQEYRRVEDLATLALPDWQCAALG